MIELQIETSTACSARCHFCPHPDIVGNSKKEVMSMEDFRSLIDQVAEIPQITDIKVVGLNEPMLDPHFVERIKYACEKLPGRSIYTFTNGFGLTPAKFDSLKAAGMSCIIFSLNAINQEQHQKIMGMVGKFDNICSNIEYAIANKGDMKIEVHSVVNKDMFTTEDALAFYQRWGHVALGGHGNCISEANWAGLNRDVKEWNSKPNEACFRALSNIYVMCDGTVTPCCYDPTGVLAFGSLKEQTLREIYNSERYVQFRWDHFQNEADKYDHCKGCNRI